MSASIVERRAAEKLAQKRCRRDVFGRDRGEIAKEFPEPVGFGIFLHIAREIAENFFGVGLHDGEFEYQR